LPDDDDDERRRRRRQLPLPAKSFPFSIFHFHLHFSIPHFHLILPPSFTITTIIVIINFTWRSQERGGTMSSVRQGKKEGRGKGRKQGREKGKKEKEGQGIGRGDEDASLEQKDLQMSFFHVNNWFHLLKVRRCANDVL